VSEPIPQAVNGLTSVDRQRGGGVAKNMSADPLEFASPAVLPNKIIDCCYGESFGFVSHLTA
jgi:hypothetical protein